MGEVSIRSVQEWSAICRKIQDLLPKDFDDTAWFLVMAAVFAGSPEPHLLAEFYTYLTTREACFSNQDDKLRLSRMLRDVLFKTITLMGMPRVLCVLTPLAKAEGDLQSRSKASTLTSKWCFENMNVQAIHDRGVATANTIYGPTLLPQIFDTWGSHREDMKFHEFFTAYGLYLSDFELLSPLTTEAVVYSSISCLGLRGPGLWHLRGIGRLLGGRGPIDSMRDGVHKDSIEMKVENLKNAVISAVEFVGDDYIASSKLKTWATIATVANDLGGWGED